MKMRSNSGVCFAVIKLLITIANTAILGWSHAETNVVLPKFTITGHFTREVKSVPIIQHTGFTIISDGKRWEIKTEAREPKRHVNEIRSGTFKYDGHYVSSSVGPSSENGDFIPPAWTSYVPEQLWLAYLSGPYFATNTSAMVRPIWHLDDDKLIRNGFLVQTRRQPLHLGLGQPRIVEFISDGRMRFHNEQGPQIVPWPAPFDAGYIEAVFSISSVTNLNGINFPSQFTFEKYGPRSENPGEKPQLVKLATTHGFTDTIRFDPDPIAVPIEWRNPKPFDIADPEYRKALENSARPSKSDFKQTF